MTNASALTALQSLNATNKSLEMTQARISTGYRVAEAARQRRLLVDRNHDALRQCGTVDSTGRAWPRRLQGRHRLHRHEQRARDRRSDQGQAGRSLQGHRFQQGKDPGRNRGASGSDEVLRRLGYLLRLQFPVGDFQAVAAANDGVQADAKIVSAFNRNSAGTATLGTIDIDIESIKLFDSGLAAEVKNFGILDRQTQIYDTVAEQKLYDDAYAASIAGGSTDIAANTAGQTAAGAAGNVTGISVYNLDITAAGVTDDIINNLITKVDKVLGELANAATKLGSAKKQIDLQKTFTQSLMDSIDRGVGQLVDADMNKESTRLQALQVQQQLGIQALSIANGNSQNILALFK